MECDSNLFHHFSHFDFSSVSAELIISGLRRSMEAGALSCPAFLVNALPTMLFGLCMKLRFLSSLKPPDSSSGKVA